MFEFFFGRVIRQISLRLLSVLLVGLLLTGCTLPRVSAEERLFLNLSIEFLGAYELPKTAIDGVPVGGLSGITYDRQRDRFYTVSDDRSRIGPARFYTLKLNLDNNTNPPRIENFAIEKVTPLLAPNGQPYPPDSVDLEGIALSPRQTLFIASEGIASQAIAPFIDEFDLDSGRWLARLPIPDRFLPRGAANDQQQGVRDNLGFEALTLNLPGFTPNSGLLEPFRLFAATEAPLQQDLPPIPISATPSPAAENAPSSEVSPPIETTEVPPLPVRLLHYLIGEDLPSLLAEHLYILDPAPPGAVFHGLTEILVLSQGGHFLSLERSFGLQGMAIKLFQFVIGAATDTSGFTALRGDLEGIQPIRKQLLLDLNTLEIPLDNLEGLTLGPQLPDGSQSLLLISDDNFSETQKNQVLLFRLRNQANAQRNGTLGS